MRFCQGPDGGMSLKTWKSMLSTLTSLNNGKSLSNMSKESNKIHSSLPAIPGITQGISLRCFLKAGTLAVPMCQYF